MLGSAEDCSFDWVYPSTSSSIIPRKSPCAVPHNISGWDELVEFYHTEASESNASPCRFSNRKRLHADTQSSHPGSIKFAKNTNSGCIVTCPICEHAIKSNWPQDSEYTLGKLVKHLQKHEGDLDSSRKVSCMLCFNFYTKSSIEEHYREYHGTAPEKYTVNDVVHFTSSIHRYQSLMDTYSQIQDLDSSVAGTCSRIPDGSVFTGYPTRKSLERCRAKWLQKFESESEPKFLFRFRISRNSSAPYAWICPLCEDSAAFSRCASFSNDVSLRLFILRHFSIEHEECEGISATLRREWKILARELGFDLSYHTMISAKLLRQTQRSCYFYILSTLQRADHEALIYEMVSRTSNRDDVNLSEFVVCVVCFNPIRRKSLFRHFSTEGHKHLNAHAEHGEFREVLEIAQDSAPTSENFPYAVLRYSKVYRIRELDDAESMTFMKWRCLLSSEISGHVDDVLEFPTVCLLKIHALKHFPTYHGGVFHQKFLDYEWELLRRELPYAAEARNYSPLSWNFDNEPFDTTNPNHFNVPFKANLLPKSFADIQICGFCFWCGYSSQFLSHIMCHGYINTGITLNNNIAKAPSIVLGLVEADNTEFKIPTKILGPAGRQYLRRLRESEGGSTSLTAIDISDQTLPEHQESSALPGEDATFDSLDLSINSHEPASSNSNSEGTSLNNTAESSLLTEYTVDSTTAVDDESDCSSINDLSICNGDSRQGVEDLPVDVGSVLANTCTSDSVSVANPQQAVSSTTNDEEAGLESSTNAGPAISSSVEEHKIAIQKKFAWDGPPPPPLDVEQTEQLMMLSRNECPFCTTARGPRGLRVPAFANDEIKEECMIAHIVRFHHDDARAAWVLNAKRYKLSMGDRANPLKFLLEPSQEGHLVCSSCEKFIFPKIANLRVHWIRCVEVCGRYRKDLRLGRLVLESPSVQSAAPRQRSKNPAVKCPIPNCISAWRPSFIYPNTVGQVSHMLARHLVDKQAYEIAVQLGNTEGLSTVFPYLDVSKSFANTLNHPKTLCLQCSKCEHGFRTPNELVQHAKRYHPTEQHYSGAPKCPFPCKRRMIRRAGMSDAVVRLIHVLRLHLDKQDAIAWIRNWPERYGSVMETERIYKFDVVDSLEESLSTGRPMIKCSFCSEVMDIEKYLRWHRKSRNACFAESVGESDDVKRLISKSKRIASRIRSEPPEEDPQRTKAMRRNMRRCEYCSRAVSLSDSYSSDVSMILHVLHAHPQNKVAVKWLQSRDYYTYVEKFPYMDIVSTVDTSLKSGKPALHCAICPFKTDTSRRLVHHARLHEEFMRSEGNYPDPCSECGQLIPMCSQMKESFQRVSHVLAKHYENEDYAREAINAYENYHSGENKVMLLNGQRSLELSQDGCVKFACNRCDFSCGNGYALIQHAKIHETIETKKEAQVIKRESPTVCPYCNRMLLCSTQYSSRVTLLSHFVKFHRLSRINVGDFMSKCATWRVSSEFPYIDPVVSIKKGKLQCAVCEASLPDVTQMLKHARTVHETYQPNVSNEEAMMDVDLSLNQPENEENEQPSTSLPRNETPKEAKIFGSICKERKVLARASASPSHQETEDDGSAVESESDRERNKASYVLRTPKEESKRESTRRLSRSYAPANDRIPHLPSSSDDELNKERNQEDNLTNIEQQTSGNESYTPTKEPESASVQDDVNDCNNQTPRGTQPTDGEHCSISLSPAEVDITGTTHQGPYTSTPKSQKPGTIVNSRAKAGSILSWLTPINRSVVPPRRAELLPDPNVSATLEGNLKDALDGSCTSLDSTVVKVNSANHVSAEGTLFDELPQRIIQKIAKQSKPPEDISHIEGAKGYPCNFCGFKARTVGDIRRHTSLAHSEVLPSLSTKIVSPCHLCNEVFETRSLLLKHITNRHTDVPEPFKCAYCPKTYATSRGMRDHERRTHESRLFLDPANLVCPHCDKEFDKGRITVAKGSIQAGTANLLLLQTAKKAHQLTRSPIIHVDLQPCLWESQNFR
ncbi:hypothetical protein Y032_0057g2827 [Ancylostoma ceylanicum]|nr:hypothetical protein Y032_0057g2827 [Ancylostoma ceylanicum]